jgi:copper resistance protein C
MERLRLVLISACVAMVIASPAAAHGDLVSTVPSEGEKLNEPTDHVIIELTETPQANASVQVTDGCNIDLTDEIFVTEKQLHVLLNDGQPGTWNVSYRIISAEDGHKTTGGFAFKVKGSAECSDPDPAPSVDPDPTDAPPDDDVDAGDEPASDESGGLPIFPLVIGGAALIGIAALVRMRSGL